MTTLTTGTTGEPGAPAQPPRRRNPWLGPIRFTGIALGACLIGGGTLSVVAQFATRVENQAFTVDDDLNAMTVDIGSGDVRVYADPAFTSVHVEATTRSGLSQATYTRSVDDGVLNLTGTCGGSWLTVGNCSVTFQITVPDDITVTTHTESGDQIITDVTKAVQARAGSGDIHVDGLGGYVVASTGSGDISAVRLGGTRAQLRTGSGDVKAAFTSATTGLTARTGSGDITARFDGSPTDVVTKTGSGDVKIYVPDDGTSYDISGSTGTGDRHIEVPTGSSERRLVADTGSGDVWIKHGG
ncbi:DUF4097 family beta strand repeat-containing protein [Kineosporia sp. NBRC 101731]|uniref:DUF4097 family beta strand repeat-containing protein n=1 Tax=Kineosporia sp. NBRC 101731 TaxID=3032199 RepID=UPI0024A367D5|nr:DUF4097 family beta strand repeat-containing protein [Kineosporia sp. NBRC 101731]GLY28016.1 hypothetical protein Kisp02_13810 [Kineosporia sp. NBRC 101731]